MLLELVASLSLLAIVLCTIFDAHRCLASLNSSANDREKKEEALLRDHLGAPEADDGRCTATPTPDGSILFWRCEIPVPGAKESERRFISDSAGYSLLEMLFALTFLSIVIVDSYPAFRQCLRERAAHETVERLDRGLDETFREIESRALSAQLLFGGENVRLIDSGSVLGRKLEDLGSSRAPSPDSALLFIAEPFAELPLRRVVTSRQDLRTKQSGALTVCGRVPEQTTFLAGVSPSGQRLYEITDRSAGAGECAIGSATELKLGPLEAAAGDEAPAVLFPLRYFEILYLDQAHTLRRYFIEDGQSEPLLYGVEAFRAAEADTSIDLTISVRESDRTREKTFTIARRSVESGLFESIAL